MSEVIALLDRGEVLMYPLLLLSVLALCIFKVKAYAFQINHYGALLIQRLATTEDVHAGRGL